jgi:anti-sigma-K factor RskA
MVHEEAAAFALDALSADHAREFERHLVACLHCADAIGALRTTAAALAFAGNPASPPARLRLRVLAVENARIVPLRRRWRRAVIAGATVAAVALLVVVGQDSSTRHVPAVAGLRAYRLQGQSSGQSLTGRILVSEAREAVLVVRGLPDPAPGTTYELWVLHGGDARPAGFVHRGMGMLTLPVPPGASIAVSLEPAGGSRRPTGPLLITVETA